MPAFLVGPALRIRNANSKGLALLGCDRLATLALIEGELGAGRPRLPPHGASRRFRARMALFTLRLRTSPEKHEDIGRRRAGRGSASA